MSQEMNDLVKLRNLLMRAWRKQYQVTIVPADRGVSIILDTGDRCIIERSAIALPDSAAYIAALTLALDEAFEEADRE